MEVNLKVGLAFFFSLNDNKVNIGASKRCYSTWNK